MLRILHEHAPYFLTFQVVGWIDVFTRQVYRDKFLESLVHRQRFDGLKVYALVIMSNHVHLILQSPNRKLSSVVRDLKAFTSRSIMEHIQENIRESRADWMESLFEEFVKYQDRNPLRQFWTHYNHPVLVTDKKAFFTRLSYIHQNPVKAGIVANASEYLYSSASPFVRNHVELSRMSWKV